MRLLVASSNQSLVLLVRKTLERFRFQITEVDNGFDAFQKVVSSHYDLILLEYSLGRMKAPEMLSRLHSLKNFKVPPALVLTLSEREREKIESEHFPQTEVIARPIAIREFVGKIQQILHQRIRVVCLGGGTGLFTLLSGLKTLSGIHLYSIVSMSDDGGSTGKLRDMFGILPPGDIRRSLVALSTAPDLLNELMQYRFESGRELKGHNIGNLLITALIQMRGSMSNAVKSLGEILNIQGDVIPVTETSNELKAELENGAIIEGEHRIDLFEGNDPKVRIKRLWQDPPVSATPDAIEALFNASLIMIGPGDLFTSVLSNLIVNGIAEAIQSSRAKKVYICNVMTKPGETTNFQISDHVREVIRYLKGDCLDSIVASTTQFHAGALKTYAKQGQKPVSEKSKKILEKMTKARIIWADVASESELVRHDSLKLAEVLKKIIEKESKK